jgi:hypothetical protein
MVLDKPSQFLRNAKKFNPLFRNVTPVAHRLKILITIKIKLKKLWNFFLQINYNFVSRDYYLNFSWNVCYPGGGGGRACLRDAMMYMFCLRAHRFICIIFIWPTFFAKKYQSPRGCVLKNLHHICKFFLCEL